MVKHGSRIRTIKGLGAVDSFLMPIRNSRVGELVALLNNDSSGWRKDRDRIERFIETIRWVKESPYERSSTLPRWPVDVVWLNRQINFPIRLEAVCRGGVLQWEPTFGTIHLLKRVLHTVVMFDQSGKLDRLRRCVWCKRWFVARSKSHRHCTLQCTQKEFRASAEQHKRHAAEMKRRRAEEKQRDARAKQSSGREPKRRKL
jgi:hypothetical protein